MTPLTSGRKNLSDIISRLNYVTPDYNGPTYNTPFRVEDPIAEIRRMRLTSVQMAHGVIKDYISNTAGASGLVSSLNSVYQLAYGAGTVVLLPADTGESIFGDKYNSTSLEFLYAKDIVEQLGGIVGNTSSIYLEMGGGNGGVVGAINNLYRKLNSHGIKVSTDVPDNSVGKEGDLWFKFEEEEEE